MTPRTLPALRAAVARVLQARGEAADALVCEAHKALRGYPRGRRWYVAIQRPGERGGPPPSWVDDTWASDEAGAIGSRASRCRVRPALVSPRVRGAVFAPSWTATERVLWLAAVDRCLRATAADSDEVRAAYRVLRALIDRTAPTLYAQSPIDPARESRWIIDARAALPPGTPAERAAVVLWAACGAWTDAPSGRWGDLAALASDLADALDGDAGCARATALRGVMADVWEAAR